MKPTKPLSPKLVTRLLVEDPAMGHRCRRCTCRITIYTFEAGWYRQCPNCLKDRIEAVLAEGEPLEGELAFTYTLVCRDVEKWDRQFFGRLTVEMPRFFRCARCDDLKLIDDARYYIPPGENSSPPYCAPCREFLQSKNGD